MKKLLERLVAFKEANKGKKGFTLIELIVVIVIIAILALIMIPSITGYIAKSNQSAVEATARSVYSEVILDLETGGVKEGENAYGNDKYTVVVDAEDEDPFISVVSEDNKYKATVTRDGVVAPGVVDPVVDEPVVDEPGE